MQSVMFALPAESAIFTAWLEAWWRKWSYRQQTIPIGDTGGDLSLSNQLSEGHRRGAVVLTAELAYVMPKLDDPTELTYTGGLRGFEWAIVSLGAERCEVEFAASDERLLPLYWAALREVALRWPDVQWIGVNPPVEGGAPDQKRKKRGKSKQTDDNAREAERLYNLGMTQAEVAELMAVSEKTAQRWLARAANLRKTQEGTHNK